jgi:hypothetical protein
MILVCCIKLFQNWFINISTLWYNLHLSLQCSIAMYFIVFVTVNRVPNDICFRQLAIVLHVLLCIVWVF